MLNLVRIENFEGYPDITCGFKGNYIITGDNTLDEWDGFSQVFESLSIFKTFCNCRMTSAILPRPGNPNKPSELEIKLNGFGYLLTLYENKVIYESLSRNKKLLAFRTDNAKDLFLNKDEFSESEMESFSVLLGVGKGYPGIFPVCFQKKPVNEVNKIVLLEDSSYIYHEEDFQLEMTRFYLDYAIDPIDIINEYFHHIGKYELRKDYKIIDRSFGGKDFIFSYDQMGSGTKRFCRLVPYLYLAKSFKSTFICNIFNNHLNPMVARGLWKDLVDDSFQIITRLKGSAELYGHGE